MRSYMSMRHADTLGREYTDVRQHSKVYPFVDYHSATGRETGMGGKAASFSSLGPPSQASESFHKGGI